MSINDWRSNARPPQFETLEQRIEREAHEERRRAFAANVTGPRHATTVDPQAARPPSPSVPTLAELDALAEAFVAATCAMAENEADRVHVAACKRAGVDARDHFNDWLENRRKPAQKPQTVDPQAADPQHVVLEILRADVERFRAVAAAREEDDIVAARKATTRADAVESAMAALTPEAERDRRVGAAVMRALNDCASDDGVSPIDSVMRFVETYSDEDNDPNGDVWAVFDAIRSALREENT